MHGWFIYVIYSSQFVTLSGDQNEVFEYPVLQSLLFIANFRKSNRHKIFFFSFTTVDFYGLIIVYSKTFSLWKRQKYYYSLIAFDERVTFGFNASGHCFVRVRMLHYLRVGSL